MDRTKALVLMVLIILIIFICRKGIKMKAFILGFILALLATPNNTRGMTGTYYWHNVIVTDDGEEWLLSGDDKDEFSDGQRVAVFFDTKGTDDITDDEIVEVKPC